jgi:hypothetical protein
VVEEGDATVLPATEAGYEGGGGVGDGACDWAGLVTIEDEVDFLREEPRSNRLLLD